jgi:protein involved in polysaccharide export with SLBB domain
VDASGNVRLPYSGPSRVAGKTPSELGKELSSYFSVRRSVTFKVEKIDSEPLNPPITNKPSIAPGKTTVLKSPKVTDGMGGF